MLKPFLDLLEKMKTTHQKKSEDYAGNNNPHENFERMALVSEWFKDPLDKVYATMVTVKLARLATCLNKEADGKGTNNESIEDSFLDLTTYCGLWYANYVERNNVIDTESRKNAIETLTQAVNKGTYFNKYPTQKKSL